MKLRQLQQTPNHASDDKMTPFKQPTGVVLFLAVWVQLPKKDDRQVCRDGRVELLLAGVDRYLFRTFETIIVRYSI